MCQVGRERGALLSPLRGARGRRLGPRGGAVGAGAQLRVGGAVVDVVQLVAAEGQQLRGVPALPHQLDELLALRRQGRGRRRRRARGWRVLDGAMLGEARVSGGVCGIEWVWG